MNSSYNPEGWDAVSPIYNQVERLTFPLAQRLVERVHSQSDLSQTNLEVFDNGCGSGVLTAVLKSKFPSIQILSTDASTDMLNILNHKIEICNWKDVKTRTLDSRKLVGIANDTFSHTFSTFMVCLAPDPDKIVQEMYRVTRPEGIVAVAVWGDPYFTFFNTPWSEACRTLIPDYESKTVMARDWTQLEYVQAGLERAGFQDVDASEEKVGWQWESIRQLSEFFLEGGNPGNVLMIDSFKMRGGKMDEVRPLFEKKLEEFYGSELKGEVRACLAVARK